ncbi:bacitracin resistance protein [Agromyces sp. LHK192]|uniref:bacitracin resistance protein n=1 Tax=Agromyces sp. LHK192 TaxID=2498704 RepID=UPI000FDC4CDA|nr:bacitracin resistance protein [Agromyces sp. LHK192]
MTAANPTAPERVAPQPLWLRATLAVVFGLFYAYDLWEVVESLVQILGLGLGFSALGWVIMVLALLAPAVLFAAAFLISRRRAVLVAVLAYLTGLAVSAVVFSSATVLLGASGGVVVP